MSLLQVTQLRVTAGNRTLIAGLDWQVDAGQCWVIIGRNGCGKSRLLHTLAGLIPTPAGTVMLNGQSLQKLSYPQRARDLGLLFQHSERGLHGHTEELVLGGSRAQRYWHSREECAQAHKALAAMGLSGLAQAPVEQLSGGELRRAEVARLLMQNPTLALLDEPDNHLDISQQQQVLNQLHQNFVNPRHALVMALHDLQLATRYASHLLLLNGDGSWQAGPVANIAHTENFSRTLGHPIRCLQVENQTIWLT